MGGFNGSGTYVRFFNWTNDKNNGINITASRFDTEDNGYATGLSTVICKDGQTTTTARIPFASGVSINAGSNSAPSITPISDSSTGFYNDASGSFSYASLGVQKLSLTSTGIVLYGTSSGTATIKVAAAAGTATIFQLPTTNGTNGQCLSTNGSGVLSWASVLAGTVGASIGGTGIDTSASTGVPTISAGTWSVAATLATSKGGTGQNFGASSGVIMLTSGTASIVATGPTFQRLTSGSGTYNTPAGVKWIKVKQVGAGGGGAGSGTSGGTAAGAGGNTTFGSSLLTANGGGAGVFQAAANAGGSVTVNSPALTIEARTGTVGGGYAQVVSINEFASGGALGAGTPLSGPTISGSIGVAGADALANSGCGGQGGGLSASAATIGGSGGSAGGYLEAVINGPSASYAYSIGAAGTAGGAGASGFAGGAGGSGYIVVEEHYTY